MAKKAKNTSVTKNFNDTHVTVAPTGLSVSRSGDVFTLSWKCGDQDYGEGQWLQYAINGAWTDVFAVGASDTSYQITRAATGVSSVEFQVCGKRKKFSTSDQRYVTNKKHVVIKTITTMKQWSTVESAWTGYQWTATPPAAPSLTYSRRTQTSGVFSWNLSPDNSGRGIFSSVILETCASRNNANPPGSGWSQYTVGSSGDTTNILPAAEDMTHGNVVRWVRVRAVGPGGSSGWTTQRHAYGNPAKPTLKSGSAIDAGTVMRVTAEWNGSFGILNPIDTITVQYAMAVPDDASMSAPEDASWSDGITVGGNGGNDKVIANITDQVDTDECMWIRLEADHDGFKVHSDAALCVFIGELATPGLVVSPNVTTGVVTFTITENTECEIAGTVIFYRSEKRPNYDEIVAVVENGTTTAEATIEEIKTSYPDHVERTCFGAYAFVGTYDNDSTTHTFTVDAVMKSKNKTVDQILPRPPAWLKLSDGKYDNTVRIDWPWSWKSATSAELSWADHDDAWESTDEPSTYDITDKNIISWIIAQLEAGKKWFFRVRLKYTDDEQELIGPWSDMYDYDLSTIPDKPVLILSRSVVDRDGTVTARWVYASSDGTSQSYADICAATISGSTITYGSILAHVSENQTVEISGDWITGQTYYLCLRLTSTAGQQSEWSDPVPLYIVPPISLNVTQNSLDEGEDNLLYLTEMPLTVTVTGAGVTGTTIVSIIRAEDYHVYRPDDSEFDGFEGEHIATHTQTGQAQITITTDDLVGMLDDGAKYILRCTVKDEYGQTASVDYQFTVAWDHQAGRPSAEVWVDDLQRIAIIKPIAPANYEEGDVCDIYRLSSDKPELVVKGGTFGTKYVDPYPAFGGHCGHRIVTRTANGDYITEDNKLAWFLADADIGDILYETGMVIDVAGEQIDLPYNIELQNSWTKDFQRTTYLGGSVQGDWNPAVTRDLSANTVILRGRDLSEQLAVRRLAGYAGPAHIRTPDGSSMTCDIQVRENWTYQSKRMSYSLVIKVVDPEQPDGMLYETWQDMNPVGEG